MVSSSSFRINSFYAEGEGCGSIPHWESIKTISIKALIIMLLLCRIVKVYEKEYSN